MIFSELGVHSFGFGPASSPSLDLSSHLSNNLLGHSLLWALLGFLLTPDGDKILHLLDDPVVPSCR